MQHKNVLIDNNNDIMALFDLISEDIKSAMKARDKVRLETLRNIKKVFLEAKTAPGANDTLADADALKIISKLAKQGKETAATYTQAGRLMQSWHKWKYLRVICRNNFPKRRLRQR